MNRPLSEIEAEVVRYLERADTSPSDYHVRRLYREAHLVTPSEDTNQDAVDTWAQDCIDKHDEAKK